MSDETDREPASPPPKGSSPPPRAKPANIAPDAVTDPSEKTGGKPGLGPQGGSGGHSHGGDETDPGSS
ncbi:hypothetical protein [Methylobacterium nigriterrae]|uniref:hypothetical protein n=1 Tax=Methylobacterium nigriterrae TaxID=3127512 RepID=UPI0030137E80